MCHGKQRTDEHYAAEQSRVGADQRSLDHLLADHRRLLSCQVERPEDSRPYGSEFRQPRRLQLAWG